MYLLKQRDSDLVSEMSPGSINIFWKSDVTTTQYGFPELIWKRYMRGT